jgi:glycosyltransferase involved in cell wall biosynthesis
LDSVAAAFAHAAPLDAELVIIDNGSTDGTKAAIEAWSAENPAVLVQLLYEPKPGLSRARNCGVRAARGDLLAFTDDDCRLSREYVAQLLAHDDNDIGLVLRGGRVELGDPTDLPLTITAPTLRRLHRRDNAARHENISNFVMGCNMAMRRALANQLGPFDEKLGAGTPINSAEDTDYIFRAYLADVTIETVPDMAVTHYHGRKTATEGYELMHGYMIGTGALYAKYLFKNPNLCRPFYWDCKLAAKEIISGTNTFLPAIGFSHRNKIACKLRGAIRYLLMRKSRKTRRAES